MSEIDREANRLRVQEKLIGRAVTLTAAVAAIFKLLAHGREIGRDDLLDFEQRLSEWNRDARAIASEEKP